MFDGSILRPLGSFAFVAVLALGVLLVGVGRQAHASGPAGLLPNLVADPPDNVSLETSTTDGGLSGTGEAKQLLRFNGYIHNDGRGALDIRGERAAPQVSQKTTNEVEAARKHDEEVEYYGEGSLTELPQKMEEELATPEMKVFQRLYTTNAGNPEESKKYLERLHETDPSAAKMLYVNADGHHHWHLQHVAKYSLWNSEKTAEVAPAEKVGFVSRTANTSNGALGRRQRSIPTKLRPAVTSASGFVPTPPVFTRESHRVGVMPTHRIWAFNGLIHRMFFQVNIGCARKSIPKGRSRKKVSGPRWPTRKKQRSSPASTRRRKRPEPRSANRSPGAHGAGIQNGERGSSTQPTYTIVSQPAHGTLSQSGTLEKGDDQVTYTPQAGYKGLDSFTFDAADPNSEFPRNPAVATVSIEVGEGQFQPSVAIEGAPSSMIAGTSVQLAAKVSNDGPAIAWEASGGSITAGGLYTAPSAPPPGGNVLVSARGEDGAADRRTITILPVPPPVAMPSATPATAEAPRSAPGGAGSTPGGSSSTSKGLSRHRSR